MRMMAMVVVGMTLIGGCGRDSDDGDGRGNAAGLRSSGAPGAKKLSELTQADQKAVCEWGDKLFLSKWPSTDKVCASLAVGVSADEASCKVAAADCVETGQNEGGLFCAESPDGLSSACLGPDDPEADMEDRCVFDGCEATVAEYEACVHGFADFLGEALVPVPCADVGKDDAGDDAGDDPTDAMSEACEKVLEQCPVEFEGAGLEFDFSAGAAFEFDRRAQLARSLDTSGVLPQAGPALAGK